MQKILQIIVVVLGVTIFEIGDVLQYPSSKSDGNCSICDRHHEQLVCNNRHNIDIERTSTISAPSAQTTSLNIQRHSQQRYQSVANSEARFSIASHSAPIFAHRLCAYNRVIDFYLYTLCQLRL
ncbi:MAG: hypothetical protein II214_00430 [Alistipes sp.]|nr:hypothetical protein [Alistipes sp.]